FPQCHLILMMFGVCVVDFSVTLSLIVTLLGLLYWYSVYPFSVLSRCGIKHPKTVPFYGNFFMFREGFYQPVIKLIKTHGRVCGYYLGRKPVVVIADPDMLRQVLVRDFSSFPNRQSLRFRTKPMIDCLLMLKNEHWKRVRSILTPSFSAVKMKEMVPLINAAAETLMNNLKGYADSGEAFDIHRCFGCFAIDVIASVAFAAQVDSQNNPDEPLVQKTQMFFSLSAFRPIFFLFVALPSIMTPLVKFFPDRRLDQMNEFFKNSIQRIIRQREQQPPEKRRRDFLQLMLEAQTRNECVSLEHFDTTDHSDLEQRRAPWDQQSGQPRSRELPARRSHKTMTEEEIVGQAFIFLLAGSETNTSALTFTCYLLALHPECQSRVQEEVDQFFTRHSSPDYSNVQELKYLDMVVSEALRLYPPFFRFARAIDRDCVVNGQLLPKGATLEIPVGFLHQDPEHWPEPERFIPERFSPEAKAARHPFVYLPFGAGPRNCVGMRLAQLEIRMALVHLLHEFSVVACSETQVRFKINVS
uniref:Thromboxane-A synthase n=1 Tax=Salarias fasciatus TaxID=181472 RepID=A0A672J540_SALFA